MSNKRNFRCQPERREAAVCQVSFPTIGGGGPTRGDRQRSEVKFPSQSQVTGVREEADIVSPNQFPIIQRAFLSNISLLLLGERAPEPERLVSCAGDDRLAIRAHRQIQHSMGMSGQRGNHVQCRVLPYAYLVLGRRRREPVRRHEFMRSQGPRQVANLDPVRTQTLNMKTVSGSLLT